MEETSLLMLKTLKPSLFTAGKYCKIAKRSTSCYVKDFQTACDGEI